MPSAPVALKMHHNLPHVLAMCVASGTFIVIILFTSGAFGHKLGLFVNNTLKLSEKYNLDKFKLDVTPDDWTFMMTGIIYMWQASWLIYSLSTVCRRIETGPLYVVYPVTPPILFVVFSFSLACNVAWLLIWDKQYMEVALVFINLMTCTLYICLVISMRRLNDWGAMMTRQKLDRDIWLVRILIQNGIGLYATWGAVAAVFNFAIVLSYKTGLKGERQEVGSTVSLVVLTMEIAAWFICDLFFWERLMRYLFTPYVIVLASLVGILSKNYDPSKRNTIYTVTLLLSTIVLTVVKVGVVIWKHYKRPVYTVNMQKYRKPVVSFEVRNLLDQ